MVSSAQEALTRLKREFGSRAAADWLEDASLLRVGEGYTLTVGTAFQQQWLMSRCADRLRELLGGPVEICAAGAPVAALRASRVAPKMSGPAGQYAIRMVRAFCEGGPAAAPLVVVHGPPHCGKSLLVDWAVARAAREIFHMDLRRISAGRSRGLVPRKRLVVADGVEVLAKRPAAQRTLCAILDTVRDRGGRVLLAMEGHPAQNEGLYPALRNRLKGGVLVSLDEPSRGDMRQQLRDRARRHGIRLPVEWEEELSQLPPAAALRALDMRMLPDRNPAVDKLERMREVSARLFGVDSDLVGRRRVVVEARRAVMAAACTHGLTESEVAAGFGLRSVRTVREACRWANAEQARDRRFAALLHEVGRVLAEE